MPGYGRDCQHWIGQHPFHEAEHLCLKFIAQFRTLLLSSRDKPVQIYAVGPNLFMGRFDNEHIGFGFVFYLIQYLQECFEKRKIKPVFSTVHALNRHVFIQFVIDLRHCLSFRNSSAILDRITGLT